MSAFKINDKFQLACPEGFRPMTKHERTQLRIAEEGDILCLTNEEEHMTVSVGWKDINVAAGLILHLIRPVKSVEAGVARSMNPYGYMRDTYLTRQIGGQKAEGFRYSYVVGDTAMIGETYVIRQMRSLTFFHMYLRAANRDNGLVQWNKLLDAVEPL